MEKLIAIGQITGVYGVSGEVKVYPLTDFLDRFENMTSVYVEDNHDCHVYHITNVSVQNGSKIILEFQECKSRDDALKLKGSYLKVKREDLVKLPKGQFYIFDVIGAKVLDDNGNYLGDVADVIKTGSNDVYVIKGADANEKEILIPALRDVVKSIDMDKREIIIKPLQGID